MGGCEAKCIVSLFRMTKMGGSVSTGGVPVYPDVEMGAGFHHLNLGKVRLLGAVLIVIIHFVYRQVKGK